MLAALGIVSPALGQEGGDGGPGLGDFIDMPRPGSSLEDDPDSYTSQDVTIQSFDGTDIQATIHEPVEGGPHPAIMMTHGWSMSRGGGGGYATAGYVVLTWDSRGFGNSGGAVTVNGENERRDASTLVDFLAQRDSVQNDGPNDPRVGMDGLSYGGGIQTRMAAEDSRIDAIVPRAMWFDLVRSLAPNDGLKLGWVRMLTWTGALSGTLDDEFAARSERIIEEHDVDQEDRDYFRSRSPVTYPDADAPMLVLNSFVDRLFPAEEGIEVARWGRESGVETALFLGNGTTHSLLGPDPPGADEYETRSDQLALDWLDYHLKGGEDPKLPPVTYYDQGRDEFVEATEFPPAATERQTIVRQLRTPVILDGTSPGPLTFEYTVGRETELVGRPEVSLSARPLGDDRHHLMSAVRKVSGGEVSVLKDQVKPIYIDGDGRHSAELTAVQDRFQPGDRIQVAIAASSETLTEVDFFIGGGLFLDSAADTGVELAAEDIELTLPLSTGAQANIPIVPGAENPPTDPDGDGLYADVNGDGTVDILDLQILYSALHSPEVQDNAWAYNFSGANPDRVTAFDLQALYNRIQATV